MVTAGIIFLIKFSFILFNNDLIIFLLLVSLFTIFISGVLALFEIDIKKLVALSTLSQIGFSIFVLRLGIYYFSLFHLIRHAIFKSCLFIFFGFIIYYSFGTQDGRFYSGLNNFFYFYHILFCVTIFCLCGLFFVGGILRKDFIVEYYSFFFRNFFLLVFSFFCILITFFYSFRMFKSVYTNFGLFNLFSLSYNSRYFFLLILGLLSIFFT